VSKAGMPFHQMPVLDVTEEGETRRIAQSHAIERFLAGRFGLLGDDEFERAQVDMIGESVSDLYNMIAPIYSDIYFLPHTDLEHKKKQLEENLEEKVPAYLKLIQAIYEENNKRDEEDQDVDTEYYDGFLVGESLTLADLQLVNFYDWLRDKRDSILAKLPALKRHYEFMRDQPIIGDFLKIRSNVKVTLFFDSAAL